MKHQPEKDNRTAFFSGVMTMFGSQLAVKVLGLLYRLVITNVDGFGDVGNGFYSAGFQLYTLLLAISSVGIPTAVSRLVAIQIAKGNRTEAYRIFKTALALFFGIGLVCSAVLFWGADFIAVSILQMDGAQYTLQALAPSITFVCVSAVIRGYFLGLGNVTASSRSQVLEQIVKSILTVVFVLALTAYSAEIMSAGANLATTVATAASTAYLALFYVRHREPIQPTDTNKKGTWQLCRSILAISIPASLGAIILSIGRVIDTATITRGIADAFAGGIPGKTGIPSAAALNAEGVRLAGMLSKSDSIINLPLALNIALETVLVPTVSSALAVGNQKEAREKISFSLLVSVLLIFPCAAGLIVLAEPIYQLIYHNAPEGYGLLQISAISMIFAAMNQTISGSLKGLGKVTVTAYAMLCGVIAKVIVNNVLIRIPSINIYGAAIGSVVCNLIAFCICFYQLHKTLPLKLPALRYLWNPLLCTGVMAASAFAVYSLLMQTVHSNAVSVVLTILVAVMVYVTMILVTRALSREDIAQLPVSGKLQSILLRFAT